MPRLAVVTASPDLPIYRELDQAAHAAGAELLVLNATRAVARAMPPAVWVDGAALATGELGAVLARVGNWRPESSLAVLETLEQAGVTSLNTSAAIRRGRDHWLTMTALAEAGVPHPETVAGCEPETLAATAAATLGFPCVVKQRRSRQGVGVVRCPDRATLEAVLDSLWRVGDEVVVQRFCPPGGVSRRVLVLDGEVVGATEHRAAPGEFRANAARGGTVRAVDPDEGQRRLALAAATLLGLGFAGVDLLPDGDDWVVGEVNPSPGWAHFGRATGIPVAERVVAALLRRA